MSRVETDGHSPVVGRRTFGGVFAKHPVDNDPVVEKNDQDVLSLPPRLFAFL